MDKQTEREKTYEILSKTDEMCYAGKWQEILEWGQKLVADPESTPTMLITWIVNGRFAAYHGKLVEEYTTLFFKIDERLQNELGRERTDNLLGHWQNELVEYRERNKPQSE